MAKYNLNELLEKKKELESKVTELLNEINRDSLTYKKEIYVDTTTKQGKEITNKDETNLNEFSVIFNGVVEELSKINTAIVKFNAENVVSLLNNREKVRTTIKYLTKLRNNLPNDKNNGRRVLRQHSDGTTLEYMDYEIKPLLDKKDIDDRITQMSAEERKLNTNIQKLNLNAEIEL